MTPLASAVHGAVLRLPPLALVLACLYGAHMHTSQEASYTWRLDADLGKVLPASHFPQAPNPSAEEASTRKEEKDEEEDGEDDPLRVQEAVLQILMTTVTNTDGSWKKTEQEGFCSTCQRPSSSSSVPRNNRGIPIVKKAGGAGADDVLDEEEEELLKGETLDCGKPVNFTYYDHLVGIQNRHTHPRMPEPDVVHTFSGKLGAPPSPPKKRSGSNRSSEIDAIERRLKKSKRERPKSVELYNQIGNFWRIKGDTQKSIECFRRALAVSPNNAEILLNLAKILFNLQYLDDAIFLTRRSLEVQPPDQNAWLQHFQLGEILKAYSHYQEAALHLRHVLELKPGYAPALKALQDMESIPDSSVHGYTVVIIVLLVIGVVFWIFSTVDVASGSGGGGGGGGGGAEENHTNGVDPANGLARGRLPFNARMRLHMRHNKRSL